MSNYDVFKKRIFSEGFIWTVLTQGKEKRFLKSRIEEAFEKIQEETTEFKWALVPCGHVFGSERSARSFLRKQNQRNQKKQSKKLYLESKVRYNGHNGIQNEEGILKAKVYQVGEGIPKTKACEDGERAPIVRN